MEQNINIKYSEKENFKLIFNFKYEAHEGNEEFKKEVTEKIKAFHKDSLIIFDEYLDIHVIQK